MRVYFEIPGKPFGKQRPRMTRQGRAYTPKETISYENLVKACYPGDKFPDDAPLGVKITAWYEIPKSTSKKKREQMLAREIRPTKVPDADNCAKAVCDSLNGIAYHDDSQVVYLSVSKYYSNVPCVQVEIFDL